MQSSRQAYAQHGADVQLPETFKLQSDATIEYHSHERQSDAATLVGVPTQSLMEYWLLLSWYTLTREAVPLTFTSQLLANTLSQLEICTPKASCWGAPHKPCR